jgi:hypothetical protein
LACLAWGCAEQTDRGQALYGEGRLIEAAQVFEHTEYRLDHASSSERAAYGVYRGLTLMALGDSRRAHHWLAYAYEVAREIPGSLNASDRTQVDHAWVVLGRIEVELIE